MNRTQQYWMLRIGLWITSVIWLTFVAGYDLPFSPLLLNGLFVLLWLSIAVAFHVPRQFSLRTLLMATTLIAVVLGLAVWMTR
jgi:hypothetical protein